MLNLHANVETQITIKVVGCCPAFLTDWLLVAALVDKLSLDLMDVLPCWFAGQSLYRLLPKCW